ncbi:MAG TPA: hypothetical protein VGP55_14545 [Chitinophagaceae bacterium]|nr:hypothetical protein [Chitinophagaceae bacterium]
MTVIRFFLFIFLTVKVLSSPAQAPDSSINFSQLPEKYYNGFHSIGNNTPRWDATYGTPSKPYFFFGSYDPFTLF